MLKKCCIILLVALAAENLARAHLGDSEEQSTTHHGASQPQPAAAPATLTLRFSSQGVGVLAEFIDGVTERITFSKEGAFTDAEVAALMESNAQGREWKPENNALNPLAKNLGLKRWRRSDRGSAHLNTEGATQRLVITSSVWLRHQLRAIAASGKGTPAAQKLTWKDFDGTGDAAQALFILNDRELGRGEIGLTALRKAIADMPKGTQILVVPYYGDPGGDTKRKYPFDLQQFMEEAKKLGIIFSTSSAG